MNPDTPFLEYLIIGAQTSSWVFLIILTIFNLPLSIFVNVGAGTIVIALPFIYLIGMLFDSLTQALLDPFRKRIRDSIFNHSTHKDEFIALKSPELYHAYEARVRRVRVIGAAIFNWPLFGICLLCNQGLGNISHTIFIFTASVIACLLSSFAWHDLYHRAYRFRKNACQLIRENKEHNIPQKQAGK